MAELSELDFSALGGKTAASRLDKVREESAKGTVINFGFIHEGRRTPEQNETKDVIVKTMPRFSIRGRFALEARRYNLWKYARAANGGKDPTYNWQQTGSCVGAGGGNMTIVLNGVEIVLKGEFEVFKWMWWLYTYGRSRFRGGMRGKGEGSFGAAWAEAALKDGLFELDPEGEPDLPDPKIDGNWAILPGNMEMEWSDGAAIAANWLSFGAKRLFHTASPITSADAAIEALANGYPITVASNFGFSPMTPAVVGKSPNQVRLVTRWNASWAHQMHINEFWDHPDLGPIFGWMNNWGPDAHGTPPSDYPPGMYYVTQAVTQQVLASRDTEAFAFSNKDGFPAREQLLREADFNPFGNR